MKRLYRFYCVDCDNAWHEILDENESNSNCDYCNKLLKAEDLKND